MTHPLFFFMDFFHRISRMNQRQSCLSDYSRIFAEFWPLANGSRPICAAVVFGHADFADDADFSSWDNFVPQISQIYTDFSSWEGFVPQISQIYADFSSWDYFCHADFTDLHRFFFVGLFLSHRFHRFTQIFFRGIIFVPQISQIYTDLFESLVNRFVRSQGVSVTTEQVASAKIRE